MKKKKVWIITLAAVLAAMAALGGYHFYGLHQMNAMHTMSFEDMLAHTTRGNSDAIITVGIIKNGAMAYDVYGEDGRKLSPQEHVYEIGSITKTFTTSLLCKAVGEGLVSLDEPIGAYLNLDSQDYYPTVGRLITHTSGYKEYYFEMPMISNFLRVGNSFTGISKEMLLKRVDRISMDDAEYPFAYSNFGFAALGAVLEKAYDKDYIHLMNEYISEDLGLENTKVSNGQGDLDGYWQWQESDAYLPAGGLLSNITDMMAYAKLHMSGSPDYLNIAHEALAKVNATTESYEKIGIRIDSVGAGWMIDVENGIVWHNGATSNFNSYLGFDKQNQLAVVILSNLPPNYRIPATVMGVEILTSLQNGENGDE
ncbi:MAG: serine hydrolase domain-containing protein [Christensenellales bacterium]|jgi:CubicO group peptidase (beta-lactamase class C family)